MLREVEVCAKGGKCVLREVQVCAKGGAEVCAKGARNRVLRGPGASVC